MKEKHIIVKERKNGFFAKGFAVLILMLVSLLCALLPLMVSGISEIAYYFYIGGGALFALFTILFIVMLYKQCNPKDALILNARGFTDTKNIGAGIEIEWTNVASVKLIDRRDNPLLGISLENTDIVLAKMKKRQADEMRENIEDNLPAILIAQNDVRISIEELKKHFIKLSREARVLEQAPQSKPKSNPFTTDDVLRAFGKLPKEDGSSAEEAEKTKISGHASEKKAAADDAASTEPEANESADDSFYNSLYKAEQNNEAPERDIPEVKQEPEYMPPEIKELLDRAKSTRISEIEKILVNPESVFTETTDESNNNAAKAMESAEEASAASVSELHESTADSGTENVVIYEDEQSFNNDFSSGSLPEAEEVYAEANDEAGEEIQIQQSESFAIETPDSEMISIRDDSSFIFFNESENENNNPDGKQTAANKSDDELIIITDSDD